MPAKSISYQQEQPKFRLMALPPEIRVRIFELVCGSKMVHIRQLPADHHTWKFRRVRNVCRAARSENESYENLMGFGIMSESQRGENKHQKCQMNGELAFDLGLLRVNRTIYREAKFLAVQTTTFSFAERWDIEDEEHSVIQDFVTNMPQEQLEHIRKVRLDMRMVDAASETKWKQTIEDFVLPKMPNIHHLYVNLNVGAALCWTQRYEDDDHVQELDWMKPVLALRRLDLHTVQPLMTLDAENRTGYDAMLSNGGFTFHSNLTKDDLKELAVTAAKALEPNLASFLFKAAVLATAAMSTKHSRLLQLPAEIKLLIWTYVCGDKLLHVHRDVGDDLIAYRICHSQDTEETIHKRFMKRGNYTTKNLPEYVDPWLYHSTCEPQNDNLDLRFLRVCKSIYEEAKLVPYQTNTFSFQYPVVFTFFYHTFPPQHRDKVRRLHLHMEMGAKVIIHRDSQSWQDAFLVRLIPAFRNITHINISIVLGSTACWNAKLPKDYRGWQSRWMQAVLALKALPLKTATVMIYDDVKRCDDHYSDPQGREIHAEGASWSNRRRRTVRQDTAEYIERELLAGGPVGRETTE